MKRVPSPRIRLLYQIREWWYLSLSALVEDSPRPVSLGIGLTLFLFGLVAWLSPAMDHFRLFDMFRAVPNHLLGFFSVVAGMILMWRGPYGNGMTWLGAMMGQFVWLWSLLSITIPNGFTISTVVYLMLTGACWWVVFRS